MQKLSESTHITDVFSPPPTDITDQYRKLAKIYHPDSPTGSAEQFQHLQRLYHQAQSPDPKVWNLPQKLYTNRFNFNYAHPEPNPVPFDMGEMYYSKNTLVYIFDAKYSSLASKYFQVFPFSDKKMEEVVSPQLPRLKTKAPLVLDDGRAAVVLEKPVNLLPLYLVGPQLNKDPRPVSWIISSLYALLCYFELSNITHNAISIPNIFIDPTLHRVSLLGGWGYSAPTSSPITRLPAFSQRYCPPDILRSKLSSSRLDLTMIKIVGQNLLNPLPPSHFLRRPSTGSAIKDYQAWFEHLGKRTFTPLYLDTKDIYHGRSTL